MKIICISDIHNKIDKVVLPPGDLLIIAGDLTIHGTINELIAFNESAGKIKNLYKFGIIAIPGNHELAAEDDFGLVKSILSNVKLIHHEEIVIDDKKIFGSAFTPYYCGWAFNVRLGPELKAKWDLIPGDVDILITHGPPYKILDATINGKNIGCPDLLDTVLRIKPKLHIFGHNHNGYGVYAFNGLTFINASTCDNFDRPINLPIEIDI